VTQVLFGSNPGKIDSKQDGCKTLTVIAPRGTGAVPIKLAYASGLVVATGFKWLYAAPGYRVFLPDGKVEGFGGDVVYKQLSAILAERHQRLTSPITAMAALPSGFGYWLASANGGVYAFGKAHFYGALRPGESTSRIVGIAPTWDMHGYWLAASNGKVFAFGDAKAYGESSIGTVTAIAGDPVGMGYWLTGPTGAVEAFGQAHYYGSLDTLLRREHKRIAGSIVSIAAAPDGRGYWLVSTTGAVYGLGDAAWHGSLTPILEACHEHLAAPVTTIWPTPDGDGYWLVGKDGGVFAFGDAHWAGAVVTHPLRVCGKKV